MTERWHQWAAAAILLLAAGLRLWHLGGPSLWMDEGFTWMVASQRFADMPAATLFADKHPPLFYWIEHLVLSCLGRSEVALRLAPAVLGVGGVGAVTWLGTRRRGPLVGLLAGLLLAVSPLHVMMSRDGRDYSLADVFLIAAAGLWWERRWVGYTVCAALALYSHYLSGVVLAWLWVGTLCVERGRFPWKEWLYSSVVVAICFAPWFPTFLAQARTPSPGHGAADWTALPDCLFTQVAGFTLNYLWMAVWWGLAALAAGLTVGAWDVGAAVVFWGTMGTLIAGSRLGIYETKYSVLVTPFFCLLAALALERRPWRHAVWMLVGVALVSNYNFLAQDEWQREDWRGVAQHLQRASGLVLIEPFYARPVVNFYLGKAAFDDQPLADARCLWLTTDYAGGIDMQRIPPDLDVWLAGNPALVDPAQNVLRALLASGRPQMRWQTYRRNAVFSVSVHCFAGRH